MDDRSETLILVSTKSQLSTAYKIYDRLSLQDEKPLILTGFDVEIENTKYFSRNMQFYQKIFKIDFHNIRQDVYNLLYSLAQSQVHKGMTLRKLTSYKEISLWDLCTPYLLSETIPYLYYINIGDKILDFEKPKKVYIINYANRLDKIFYLLCKKKTVDCNLEEIEKKNRISLIINNYIYRSFMYIKKIKKLLVSFCYFSVNLMKSFRLKNRYKIIFFAPLERFLISMLPVINKYNDFERLVINTFPSGASKKLSENKIFYMDFYGYKLYSLFNWTSQNLLKNISVAIHNNNFFSKISYKGVMLRDLFTNIIERLIYNEFPEKIRMINIIRKIILLYKPNAVVTSDVSCDITLIAKSVSQSVIALQCAHPGEFICFGSVAADAITVDGNFWRDFLIKHNVDPAKIWVTGSPKFDILENAKVHTKKINLLRNLTSFKKIVIFAAPYCSLASGRIEYEKIEKLKSVCNAIKNIENAYLMIKLHPFDNDRCIYEKIVKETGLLNYSLIKDIEMLKLLKFCDLLITYHSVAGYEAVLMDKNVVWICNSSDFQTVDAWDFRRYEPVMIVENLAELENRIQDVLFNPQTLSILKKNREEYRLKHIYKLDGNAADRVKKVIDRFCNNKYHNTTNNQPFREYSAHVK